MVVVQAVVPLFHNHLVAVRGAMLVEPSGIIKVVRVDDKRISLPMANYCIRTNVSLTPFAQDRQSAQNGQPAPAQKASTATAQPFDPHVPLSELSAIRTRFVMSLLSTSFGANVPRC